VLVTRGLYELIGSDAELAAILGHEINHIVQRDHYEVIRKQELHSAGQDLVSSNVSTGGGVAGGLARGTSRSTARRSWRPASIAKPNIAPTKPRRSTLHALG
jgi:predicted Zn-dependent protease